MHQSSLWKELLGGAILIFFAVVGVAHMLYPDGFMKPWHRGGEMLTDWNRSQIRIVGAIILFLVVGISHDIVSELVRR